MVHAPSACGRPARPKEHEGPLEGPHGEQVIQRFAVLHIALHWLRENTLNLSRFAMEFRLSPEQWSFVQARLADSTGRWELTVRRGGGAGASGVAATQVPLHGALLHQRGVHAPGLWGPPQAVRPPARRHPRSSGIPPTHHNIFPDIFVCFIERRIFHLVIQSLLPGKHRCESNFPYFFKL
jgi:hypothetical protein